ncbi:MULTISPECIES: TadE/TadG family type IV pilus assembly protein [unclassified Streptomyces]|uniref:TadE/TadG family type IV pilus assembly protein n=1 Tax=unclassified Streptomyces TaxID=2593676 RepID=UPI002DD9B1F7|nr:TadE/TadG family type IV pilus assembly protein [Streptomyces sp. NBC_01750]WSB00597.1 pilus assembly protein [Streptomyces sp. NBC_01794]WSD35048.1 pilus assembly protein [Streptomyces sp. NBC_01750]
MRSPGTPSRTTVRLRGDRGQAAIEFTGMVPIVLATMVLLWQAALVGYTFSLAGNAADEAARAGAVARADQSAACQGAGREHLPEAWRGAAEFDCPPSGGDLFTATVSLRVPVLFPGSVNLPFSVDGSASAVNEAAR